MFFSVGIMYDNAVELCNKFSSALAQAVEKYKEINGDYPTSVIVYRDGVGDGQIGDVIEVSPPPSKQGCQIFLVTTYQSVQNIPK
jgi:aubergine-like protein